MDVVSLSHFNTVHINLSLLPELCTRGRNMNWYKTTLELLLPSNFPNKQILTTNILLTEYYIMNYLYVTSPTGRCPVIPSPSRHTRPSPRIVTTVILQLPKLILSQASGFSCRTLHTKYRNTFPCPTMISTVFSLPAL